MKILHSTLVALAIAGPVGLVAQQNVSQAAKSPRPIHTPHATFGSRSITVGINSLTNYVPGTTMDLTFELNLTTPDDEYGDSVSITFPSGFIINSASNPIAVATEGQTDEVLNLPIVSPTVTWGDNDNSYGGIEPGVHTFIVNVTIPAGTTGNQTISWHVDGDEWGAAPNFYAGTTTLQEVASTPDLAVFGFSANPFAQIPSNLNYTFEMASLVMNAGADLTTATSLNVSNSTLNYNATMPLSNPLVNGQIDTLFLPNISTGNTIGNHAVVFDAPLANDNDITDNTDTVYINVTDSSLSYAGTVTDGSLSLGDGAEGILGSFFAIPNNADLTSVDVFMPQPDVTSHISLVIFDRNATTDLPNNLLWESDTIGVTGGASTTINFPVGLNLTGGNDYLIGVREQLVGGCSVGTNTATYLANTHFAYFQNAWTDLGDFNFLVSLAIIPNFGTTAAAPDTCVADFTHNVSSTNTLEVEFTNTSTTTGSAALTYAWDFGDGNSSTQENPTHMFDSAGTYNVCLIVSSTDCSDSTCAMVTVQDTTNSVEELGLSQVKLFPNPAADNVVITVEESASMEVLNIAGSVVIPTQKVMGKATINVADLANGVYFVKVATNEGILVKQLVIRK